MKLEKMIAVMSKYVRATANNKIADIIERLNKYIFDMNNFNMEDLTSAVNEIEEEVELKMQGTVDRKQFREV